MRNNYNNMDKSESMDASIREPTPEETPATAWAIALQKFKIKACVLLTNKKIFKVQLFY
jgi:hypothetical protein